MTNTSNIDYQSRLAIAEKAERIAKHEIQNAKAKLKSGIAKFDATKVVAAQATLKTLTPGLGNRTNTPAPTGMLFNLSYVYPSGKGRYTVQRKGQFDKADLPAAIAQAEYQGSLYTPSADEGIDDLTAEFAAGYQALAETQTINDNGRTEFDRYSSDENGHYVATRVKAA